MSGIRRSRAAASPSLQAWRRLVTSPGVGIGVRLVPTDRSLADRGDEGPRPTLTVSEGTRRLRPSLGRRRVPDERWQRVKTVYGAALERPPEARDAYVQEACGGGDRRQRGGEAR